MLMQCIHCGHSHTYLLGNAQRKCAACRRKFSVRKVEREATLRVWFDRGESARHTAEQTRMHLATVLRYFEQFRREVAWESEEMYRAPAHDVSEYDEYFYLPSASGRLITSTKSATFSLWPTASGSTTSSSPMSVATPPPKPTTNAS